MILKRVFVNSQNKSAFLVTNGSQAGAQGVRPWAPKIVTYSEVTKVECWKNEAFWTKKIGRVPISTKFIFYKELILFCYS